MEEQSPEIIEGLKIALSKGETLKSAMMSFYNAGYPKQEIESAAKLLQMKEFEKTTQPGYNPEQAKNKTPSAQPAKTPDKKTPEDKKTKTPDKNTNPPKKQIGPVQKVSKYETKPKKSKKRFIILMIILLLILVGAMIALVLFREKIFGLFS